jgi:hypothetical protein
LAIESLNYFFRQLHFCIFHAKLFLGEFNRISVQIGWL